MENKISDIEKKVERHDEKITTLFKRVDEMDGIQRTLHNLDKSYALQSQLLQNIVEHNKKQDERMNKQDEINLKQSETLSNINSNLSNLNTKVEKLEKGQDELAKRVDDAEEKGKIDIIVMAKNLVLKYILPLGVLYGLVELVKSNM